MSKQAELENAVLEVKQCSRKMGQMFRDFRSTPSATNYVHMQECMLAYQQTKQRVWDLKAEMSKSGRR